jgi:hypothetical protein
LIFGARSIALAVLRSAARAGYQSPGMTATMGD